MTRTSSSRTDAIILGGAARPGRRLPQTFVGGSVVMSDVANDPSATSPLRAAGGWRYQGQLFPPFAVEPAPGQDVATAYLPAPGSSV